MARDQELGMDDILPWGKYEDQQIEDVLGDDPEYLQWLADEDKIHFDEEVLMKLSFL